jgi:hypothetical protein
MNFKLLLLISLVAIQIHAMQYKDSDLIEPSEKTKSLVTQAIIDYQLDPKEYAIKSFKTPQGGCADDISKLIIVNADESNPDIFRIYHEAGHMKDEPSSRSLLIETGSFLGSVFTVTPIGAYCANKYIFAPAFNYLGNKHISLLSPVCATFCTLIPSCYIGFKIAGYAKRKSQEYSELIANRLACQKLLEKKNFDSICDRLAMLKTRVIDKIPGKYGHAAPDIEYEDLKATLNKNNISINAHISDSKDTVTIQLNDNKGSLLSKKSLGKIKTR